MTNVPFYRLEPVFGNGTFDWNQWREIPTFKRLEARAAGEQELNRFPFVIVLGEILVAAHSVAQGKTPTQAHIQKLGIRLILKGRRQLPTAS